MEMNWNENDEQKIVPRERDKFDYSSALFGLPKEILDEKILYWLDVETLLFLSEVSHTARTWASNNNLWEILFVDKWKRFRPISGTLKPRPPDKPKDWQHKVWGVKKGKRGGFPKEHRIKVKEKKIKVKKSKKPTLELPYEICWKQRYGDRYMEHYFRRKKHTPRVDHPSPEQSDHKEDLIKRKGKGRLVRLKQRRGSQTEECVECGFPLELRKSKASSELVKYCPNPDCANFERA